MLDSTQSSDGVITKPEGRRPGPAEGAPWRSRIRCAGGSELYGPARGRRLAERRSRRPRGHDDQEERKPAGPDPGHDRGRKLRELTAAEVHQALTTMALRYSSAAVAMGHNALTRSIRHAEARDLVGRNVAMFVDTPKGQAGRPSKSLSLEQASALLAAAAGTRMHAYIALCLATGIRTEEARALRWEHVNFGDPAAMPPVPASAAVWRSVRAHGDTKTEKSRRTLGLPQMAVDALLAHKKRQAEERLATGAPWSEHDLVFSSRTGAPLDAANVRREFRAICKAAGIGECWTPRELRHSFVSLILRSADVSLA